MAQQYPQDPTPQRGGEDPGKTLGIVGLVLAFLAAPVGLILSIVARSKSKKAGFSNGLATGGIVVGALVVIGWIILIIVLVVTAVTLAGVCADLGPGIHQQGGVTYRCG